MNIYTLITEETDSLADRQMCYIIFMRSELILKLSKSPDLCGISSWYRDFNCVWNKSW